MKKWKLLPISVMALAGTNCTQGEHVVSDNLSLFAAVCDGQLKAAFQNSYHPFLIQKCSGCHSTAHASTDVNVAYPAFMERGTTLIDYQATHAHGGNTLSGTETQPLIDAFKPRWVSAQSDYLECLVEASGGVGGSKFALADKPVPNLMATTTNNNWAPVEWDLSTEAANPANNGRFAAFFRAEARVHMVNGTAQGINFRNPSLRLKTGSQNIEVKTLSIRIEGDEQNLVTTYSGVSAIVNSTTNTLLVPNSSAALAYFPAVSDSTKVSFIIESIQHTALNPIAGGTPPTVPITPVPIPNVPIPAGGVKYSQLVDNNSIYRVFARSCVGCHNGNNMSGGLNLTNYDAAKLKTVQIQTRMNSTASPMPPSGVLRQNDRDLVQSWIDNGAQN